MSFRGEAGAFFKMLLRGGLLQIPTFGFYRFWLTTQVRRHLWANTRIGGEAFEYTGTAKEILVGFLIALAILVPIYIAYFLLGILAEEIQAFASIPLFVLMWVLGYFASYRSRNYRATRTTFRGLRFWMDGSGWAYAGRAMLWDVATVLTLGLAYPWRVASLERYKMRHTHFGDLRGDFVGTGWTLFRRAGWMWLGGIVTMGTMSYIIGKVGEKPDPASLALVAILYVILGLAVPFFLAIQTRWHAEGLRLGSVAVNSTLRPGAYLGTFLKLFFASVGLVIVFSIVGAFALVPFMPSSEKLAVTGVTGTLIASVALLVVIYLTLIVLMGAVQTYFMSRGLWSVLVSSISITNLSAIDSAVAAGQPANAVGEGLADAFDFGA
jgi:uncharacterized membrane protein YjgN (DUF898 family)